MDRYEFVQTLLQSLFGLEEFVPREVRLHGFVLAGNLLWDRQARNPTVRDLQMLELQLYVYLTAGQGPRQLYRNKHISTQMDHWFAWYARELNWLEPENVIDVCARAEWELYHRIRPYQRMCMVMTRFWSALPCLRAGTPILTGIDHRVHASKMLEGREAFVDYYRALRSIYWA
jgi:hypothetical protein